MSSWIFTPWLYLALVVVSLVFSRSVLWWLTRRQFLDLPNARSSHSLPTPGSGGLSFLVVYLAALPFFYQLIPSQELIAVAVSGGFLGWIGWLDDRRDLSARLRLVCQLLTIGFAIFLVFSHWFNLLDWQRLLLLIIFVVGAVWWINLFNFLDGIDGYAVVEALFISVAAAGLCYWQGDSRYWPLFITLACAITGFLLLNWSPAKVFMGDVGSYFLGGTIALLALMTINAGLISPLVWLVLTALFWVDASYTLIRRALSGQRWLQAHRSHAYQILSRRWQSHGRVSVMALLVNLFWLGPIAFICHYLLLEDYWIYAWLMLLVASFPLLYIAKILDAGMDNG